LLHAMNTIAGDVALTKKIFINAGYAAHAVGAALLARQMVDTN
jgi:hypothetical protein